MTQEEVLEEMRRHHDSEHRYWKDLAEDNPEVDPHSREHAKFHMEFHARALAVVEDIQARIEKMRAESEA